jgi:hypothetical protein
VYSFQPSVGGAEAAGRGYLASSTRPPSPVQSLRPPSVAGSVASHVYHASTPKTRVRRPSPMRNARRRVRSSTPASARHSVLEIPQDIPVPDLPHSGSGTTGSIHGDRNSVALGSDHLPAPPKGNLRPMTGIDRYEKHKKIKIEDLDNEHICPPVTVQFTRLVSRFPRETTSLDLLRFLASPLPKTGFLLCTPRAPCTGSMRRR